MRGSILTLLCFVTSAATSLPSQAVNAIESYNDCDDSFPVISADVLAALSPTQHDDADSEFGSGEIQNDGGQKRQLVALPNDPRSYAPLCTSVSPNNDENVMPVSTFRIDLRHLVSCNAGSCWSNYYQQCTFECTWNEERPPTTRPTPKPTVRIVDTTHPVRLTFRGVPDNYFITKEVKSLILKYVTEIYMNNLSESDMELVEVAFATQFNGSGEGRNLRGDQERRAMSKSRSRELSYTLYIPFRVTVRGPEDVSDFALVYALQVLRDNLNSLINSLVSMKGEAYENFRFTSVKVESFEERDWKDMMDSQNRTPMPTMRPTQLFVEEEEVDLNIQTSVMEDTPKGGNKWWIWLIIAVILITIVVCGCIVVARMRRDREEANVVKNTYNMNHQQLSTQARRRRSSNNSYYHRPRPARNESMYSTNRSHHTKSSRYTTTTSHRHDKRRLSRRPSKRPRRSALSVIESEVSDYEIEVNRRKSDGDEPIDPPEEMAMVLYNPTNGNNADNNALVLYSPVDNIGNNRLKREPTEYIDGNQNYALVLYPPEQEPRGEKVPTKPSMYAEDVHFHTNANTEEPDGVMALTNGSRFVDDMSDGDASGGTSEFYQDSTKMEPIAAAVSVKSSKKKKKGDKGQKNSSRRSSAAISNNNIKRDRNRSVKKKPWNKGEVSSNSESDYEDNIAEDRTRIKEWDDAMLSHYSSDEDTSFLTQPPGHQC